TCERRAVHGEACAQSFLIRRSENRKPRQQTELRDFDISLAELLVVDAGDKPCKPAETLTCAHKRKERHRCLGILISTVHNKMYIHLSSLCQLRYRMARAWRPA